jgi:hypothetical protein
MAFIFKSNAGRTNRHVLSKPLAQISDAPPSDVFNDSMQVTVSEIIPARLRIVPRSWATMRGIRTNVRFWPKADMRCALQMSAFGGKADMLCTAICVLLIWSNRASREFARRSSENRNPNTNNSQQLFERNRPQK